jgi:glycosyltransferase involved in cell wall biosynthesis
VADAYDVAVVVPSLGRSGGLRVLAEWSARLAASGRRVAVCTAATGPGAAILGPDVDVFAPSQARHRRDEVELRLRRPRSGMAADLRVYPRTVRAQLRRLPRAKRYVLGFAPWADALAIDGPVLPYCQHWEPVWFDGSPLARATAEAAMLAPGAKVVNSSWLRAHWEAARWPDLHLVHPGVDLDVYRPGPAGASPAAGTAARPLRIAALGRDNVPWKGVAELRQALAASGVRAELQLFGTAHTGVVDRPWGREVAHGGLSPAELSELFRSVDLVVTASWFESFPLPPLEAMASGTAVLTTREGTEDYAVDRVNALVVPGRDVPGLTSALAELAGDPGLRDQLAEAGLATAAQFSWAAGFEAFEQALAQTDG